MQYDNCQYSNIIWIAKESTQFKALKEGLTGRDPVAAVDTFFTTLGTAQQAFKKALKPGADLTSLLAQYQSATGIISTRDYTLPSEPEPGNPSENSFFLDLIEGIAGAASTEVGIGIALYTLIMDVIEWLELKVHVRGILMNAGTSKLDDIDLECFGQLTVVPFSVSIPGMKSILNPVTKKNVDCVGFAFFGGVGSDWSAQGFQFFVRASPDVDARLQYATFRKGIGPSSGDEVETVYRTGDVIGVLVDKGLLNTVCLFCRNWRD
ncbi:MAG TPA: hypothetical protein VFW71_10855 [Actinomycetota bacterium]|nr:hypothetical protein [Actinomycetota bacterium]